MNRPLENKAAIKKAIAFSEERIKRVEKTAEICIKQLSAHTREIIRKQCAEHLKEAKEEMEKVKRQVEKMPDDENLSQVKIFVLASPLIIFIIWMIAVLSFNRS